MPAIARGGAFSSSWFISAAHGIPVPWPRWPEGSASRLLVERRSFLPPECAPRRDASVVLYWIAAAFRLPDLAGQSQSRPSREHRPLNADRLQSDDRSPVRLIPQGFQQWIPRGAGETEILPRPRCAATRPRESTGAPIERLVASSSVKAMFRARLATTQRTWRKRSILRWQSMSIPIGSSNPLSGFPPICIAILCSPLHLLDRQRSRNRKSAQEFIRENLSRSLKHMKVGSPLHARRQRNVSLRIVCAARLFAVWIAGQRVGTGARATADFLEFASATFPFQY